MRLAVLPLAISTLLGTAPVLAATDHQSAHNTDLEVITVRALPMARSKLETTQPVEVLAAEVLDDRRGMTLGETLQQQPGVQSSFYGLGAGRPVVRGLGGPRVKILENNLSTLDVSAQSDDHAVSTDPMLVEQIEILRGPSALLFGAGATGGVVNLVDNRIPSRSPTEPFSGAVELRADTVADQRSGVARLDGGTPQLAWHLDGTWRETDDYRIPGEARFEGDDHDHEEEGEGEAHESSHGRVENSFVENQSWTAGASHIGDRGHIGLAYNRFDSSYGIPAPHSHADEAHEETGEEETFAAIDLRQHRWDLSGALNAPLPGIARGNLRLAYNDYRHTELESESGAVDEHADHEEEHDEEAHAHGGTRYELEAYQARLELETRPLAGWEGAIGAQFEHTDFHAEGEEAFIAPNETRHYGLFLLQERQLDDVTLSLGARLDGTRIQGSSNVVDHEDDHADHDHEQDDHSTEPFDQRTFHTWSTSLGAIWHISERWQSSLSFSRAQRAPSAAELLANGPHLATFTFDVGDTGLGKETTQAWDLIVHRHHQSFDFEISLFQKDIRNFIHFATHDETHDGMPVREVQQTSAEFYGFEVQGVRHIELGELGALDVRLAYDMVRGRLEDGGDLPRISPQRLLAGLDWYQGGWRGSLEWQHVFDQNHVAAFERKTDGYDRLNARLAYAFNVSNAETELFAQANNLTDSQARVHTSYLKDYAPLPGRNFVAGLRVRF